MKPNQPLRTLAILCSLGMLASAAHSHVTLQNKKAEAGAHDRAVLQVSHGCEGGSPTRQVTVDIPDGVLGAKSMAKPGRTVEVTKAKLPKPYTWHGNTVSEDVTQVRWSGGTLADAHYDEFMVLAKLSEQTGPLYWKVSQICEQGRIDWKETPAAGKNLSDYKRPAAAVEVVSPGASEAPHRPHH